MFYSKTPFVIAEIGANHEGDFARAIKLVSEAAQHDIVSAIKIQIYNGDGIVNKKLDSTRHAHFDKFSLSLHEYEFLGLITKEMGKLFGASVWNESLIDYFAPKLDFFKVGSGDLTAHFILQKIRKSRLPVVLSTGLSTMAEIEGAVKELTLGGDDREVAILQCTSTYPTSAEELNLKTIYQLNSHGIAGYSHHQENSIDGLCLAYAMGAQVLEFHYTDDRTREFRDHKVSLDDKMVKEFSRQVREIDIMKGSRFKVPTIKEIESGNVTSMRRGLYFRKDMKEGAVVNLEDLVALRPNFGIPANCEYLVIGKRLVRNVEALEPLKEDYFK